MGGDVLLGCIADDFTGATDLANTLTRRGMACVQYNGLPGAGQAAAGEDAAEELEETAKLYLILQVRPYRCLNEAQLGELAQAFPS